ncbi:MAG: TolC family protein [Candidatus Binatia bacterium]
MRAELAVVLALVLGCGPTRVLTRPDGDGGWSTERRGDELATRARAAKIMLDGGAVPMGDDPAAPLALDDVVRMATSGNLRIAEADREVAIAGERVADARGRLLPNVTGRGRQTWYTSAQRVQFAGAVPVGVPTGFEIQPQDFATFNGTATVPIDLWGEIVKGLTATQAGYRAEEARRFATVLGEQVSAVRSYFALLEAERLRDVAEQTLSAQRQQLANAESRVAAGRLTKNELLVVQVAVRNTEQIARQRDLRIAEARWMLNQTIGRPIDAPTRVADVRARPDVPAAADALRDAYAHNPVLLALVEEQQRLEDTASALARGRLPRLQGGGAIDYSTSDILQPQRMGSGFVGFAWDLGTDGRREAQLAEAKIAADENRIRIQRSLREVETAVRTTQHAAEERLTAFTTAEVAVQQAEENLRIRDQQFDVGRATSEDVLAAEALLAEQRAVLAQALYQAHTRRAELQQVMGLPLDAILPTQR